MQQRMREMREGQQGGNSGRQQNQQGQRGEQSGQQQQQGQSRGQNQTGQQQGMQDNRGLQGQNPENPQGGAPGSDTDVRGLSGNAFGPPTGAGIYRNEQERQLSREFEQRLADAQGLRRLLDRNSTQMENLDKVIESLRRAGDYRNYSNPEQIARLKNAIDYMRKVEFDLARDLERMNQGDRYFFAEDNEAPSNYQRLVEEYYKSIAKYK